MKEKPFEQPPYTQSFNPKGAVTRLLEHLKIPLFRNGYALAFSAAATSAFGLLYWILAARFYPANIVGINSAILSAMMLLSGIAQLSLNSVLVRFVPVAGKSTRRLVLYAYLTSLAASLLVSLVFSLGLRLWAPSLSFLVEQPAWLVFFVFASLIWSLFSLQDSVLTGLRQAVWVPLENSVFAISKIVLLILFATLLPEFGIFAAWILPVAVLVIPVNVFIFKSLIPAHTQSAPNTTQPVLSRWLVKFIAGNYLGTLFTLISTTLLPILVLEIAGASANAYFYLPWTIISSIQLLAFNMTTSMTVEAARDQEHTSAYGYRILTHTSRLLLPVVVVLLLGAPWILKIFGSAYASQGVNLLRLLALSILPNLVNVLYISLARVQNRIGGIILAQAVLAVLVLGLSVLLLPRIGIAGVGWAWFCGQSLIAIFLLFFVLRPIFSNGKTGEEKDK